MRWGGEEGVFTGWGIVDEVEEFFREGDGEFGGCHGGEWSWGLAVGEICEILRTAEDPQHQ
jgi:hypothetical protein